MASRSACSAEIYVGQCGHNVFPGLGFLVKSHRILQVQDDAVRPQLGRLGHLVNAVAR
jgi:hypothetical protein